MRPSGQKFKTTAAQALSVLGYEIGQEMKKTRRAGQRQLMRYPAWLGQLLEGRLSFAGHDWQCSSPFEQQRNWTDVETDNGVAVVVKVEEATAELNFVSIENHYEDYAWFECPSPGVGQTAVAGYTRTRSQMQPQQQRSANQK